MQQYPAARLATTRTSSLYASMRMSFSFLVEQVLRDQPIACEPITSKAAGSLASAQKERRPLTALPTMKRVASTSKRATA